MAPAVATTVFKNA
ncbi:hypothetical protein YPPY66_3901, partial [Yersinia pestis PY-66]